MASCSIESAQVFVPRTEFSRYAVVLWLLQFSLAVLAIAFSGLVLYVKCVGVLAVVLLAFFNRPQRTRAIAIAHSGSWMLPDDDLADLRLLAGTRFTQYWAVIHFGRDAVKQQVVCVWSDTLGPQDWRQLLIRLSEYSEDAC